jgi:hypothetical protein
MGAGRGSAEVEDPQQVYNRDREQMERSLDSLRRSTKTEAVAHRYIKTYRLTYITYIHLITYLYNITYILLMLILNAYH